MQRALARDVGQLAWHGAAVLAGGHQTTRPPSRPSWRAWKACTSSSVRADVDRQRAVDLLRVELAQALVAGVRVVDDQHVEVAERIRLATSAGGARGP